MADSHTVTVLSDYHLPYSAVNSLWAARDQHDGWLADTIFLLAPASGGALQDERSHNLTKTLVEQWHEGYRGRADVRTVNVNPNDLPGIRGKVEHRLEGLRAEAVDREDAEELKVALDVTPGRTFVKQALFDLARHLHPPPAHVFYLSVGGYDYRELPYPLIPRRIQTSRDVVDQVIEDSA